MDWEDLDWIDLQLAEPNEYGNEPSGSVRCGQCIS